MSITDSKVFKLSKIFRMPTLKLRLKKENSLLYLITMLEEILKRVKAEVRS